jgi:hypothetical protein
MLLQHKHTSYFTAVRSPVLLQLPLDKLQLRIPEDISLVTYDALYLHLKSKLDITRIKLLKAA